MATHSSILAWRIPWTERTLSGPWRYVWAVFTFDFMSIWLSKYMCGDLIASYHTIPPVNPGHPDRGVLASGQSVSLNSVCGETDEMVLHGLGFLKEREDIREMKIKERQRMFTTNLIIYQEKWSESRSAAAAAAAAAKSLQSCPTMQPHRWQPTRLPCPWDSPGKNTGVGCHFLLQCMKVKSVAHGNSGRQLISGYPGNKKRHFEEN